MAIILKLDSVSKSFARVETNDITNALEEKDREEFTRLKVIKRSTTK